MPNQIPPAAPSGVDFYMLLAKLDAKMDGVTGEIKGLKDDIKQLREDVNKDLGAIEGRVSTLERDLGDRPQLKKEWDAYKIEVNNLKDLVHQVKGGLTMAKIIFGIAGAIPVGILVAILNMGDAPKQTDHQAPQAQVQKVQ